MYQVFLPSVTARQGASAHDTPLHLKILICSWVRVSFLENTSWERVGRTRTRYTSLGEQIDYEHSAVAAVAVAHRACRLICRG